MKSLFEKIKSKKVVSMEKATAEERDQEVFVKKCIKANGADEFKLASERLKSDAVFILDLVATCPEIIKHCEEVVIDNTTTNQPVDEMLFVYLCCKKNMDCFKYFSNQTAKKYMDLLQSGEKINGKFNGKELSVNLGGDEDYIDLLKYVKYGILNSKSIYVQCAEN